MYRLVVLILCAALLIGCEQSGTDSETVTAPAAAAQGSKSEDAVNAVQDETQTIDRERFMLARELLDLIESGPGVFVFDVRARASFDQSHIRDALSMPYGKIDEQDLSAVADLSLDSTIVTYCGCPHHLAKLSADQLIAWGYRNVRVLYEGYWHWRDHSYPITGAQAKTTTTIDFSGALRQQDRPVANADVFIESLKNGQLEATSTDADGRFDVSFHLYDHRPQDRFSIRVGSLDSRVLLRTGASDYDNGRLQSLLIRME